jgi:dephospho-CoA kinase
MKLEKFIEKTKNAIPEYILTFPINKKEIVKSILSNQKNLKKIIDIVHPIVRSRMNKFIYKNKKKKMIVLDVPLLLENKIEKKTNILVFVDAKKKEIIKNLKKRKNYNLKIMKILKKFQLPLNYNKKKADFVIKNNFKMQPVKKSVKLLKKKLLYK